MTITEFIWPRDRIEHIGKHGVEPNEVEEVCFGQSLVQHAKSSGKNPLYYILGETAAGRRLFCVVIKFPEGKGFPVTAREMTDGEEKRYNRWKKQ